MRCFRYMMLLFAVTISANAFSSNTAISPATYEALTDVQELLQQQQYPEAEEQLSKLKEKLKPSFGLALVHQLYGQLYLSQDKTSAAIGEFEAALALNVLPVAQEASMAANVAQLYLSLENSGAAITLLSSRLPRLLKQEQELLESGKKKVGLIIQPMVFATLGLAYHLEQNYPGVVQWMPMAIERSDGPKESWLQVLSLAYYQQQQYDSAAEVLAQLIVLKPDNEDYWVQRASMFQLLEQPANTLAVLESAYAAGVLKKDNNLLLLVQLLISQGIPERGARVLNRAISENQIELNEANWKLLAMAWQQGREREDAIVALSQAANMSENGSLLLRAARLAFQDNHHQQAAELAEQAYEMGLSAKEQASSLLLAGTGWFELQRYPQARTWFQRALKEPDSAAAARTWLDYIDTLEEYL